MYLDRHYRHLWWTILTAFTSIHKRSGNNDSHCQQSAARHSERSGIACLSHPWRQASYGLCMATQFAPALCSPTGSPCQPAVSGCSPRSVCIVRLFTLVRLQRPAVRPGYDTRLWAVIRKKDKDINRPAGYASYLQTGVTLDIAQVTPY